MERWSIARMKDGSFALTCDERYIDEFEDAFSAVAEAILETTHIHGEMIENTGSAKETEILCNLC